MAVATLAVKQNSVGLGDHQPHICRAFLVLFRVHNTSDPLISVAQCDCDVINNGKKFVLPLQPFVMTVVALTKPIVNLGEEASFMYIELTMCVTALLPYVT